MLSASRRQPHLLHVSAVDHRQTWSVDKSWRCVTLSGFLRSSHSSLSVKPHFLWHALQWPWPVRKRFSSDHWCLWRSKLGSRIVGSTTKVELTFISIVFPPPTCDINWLQVPPQWFAQFQTKWRRVMAQCRKRWLNLTFTSKLLGPRPSLPVFSK